MLEGKSGDSMIKDETDESGNPPNILPVEVIVLKNKKKKPATTAIRYVEARRIGTCAFADRIATLSIQHYQTHIDEEIRTNILPQTCIATIVAAFHVTNLPLSSSSLQQKQEQEQEKEQVTNLPPIVDLKVLAMGVGTKFLSEQILKSERGELHPNTNTDNDETDDIISAAITGTTTKTEQYYCYGTLIRDCHAEVLCRRAFRKYLLDSIEQTELEGLLQCMDFETTRSNDCHETIQ